MSETAKPGLIERMFGPRPVSAAVAKVTHVEMFSFNGASGQGFALRWQIEGVGFGEFSFSRDHKTGAYTVDNESMGRAWVERVLLAFLAKCELEDAAPVSPPPSDAQRGAE